MVRTAAPEGRAGTSSAPDSALLVLPAADEPDEPRLGAASGFRARVGAALVGGGDPPQQPELVAGGRCRRERRAPGPGRARAAENLQPRERLSSTQRRSPRQSGRGGPVGFFYQPSAAQTRVSFPAETSQPCPPHHPVPRTVSALFKDCWSFCIGTGAKWGNR